MAAETGPSPEDLRKNVHRLQANLNVVQTELDQALGVWRTILDVEKQEFRKTLDDHRKNWERSETQWHKDREAYAKKIQDLETFFNEQLAATEKNAVRALNELDAAWQQERVRWQQTLVQQTKESRQREDLQSAAQQLLEKRLSEALQDNVRLHERHEETQDVLSHWQSEKSAWQESFSERLQDMRLDTAKAPQLETYLRSLETQIAGLKDFIERLAPAESSARAN